MSLDWIPDVAALLAFAGLVLGMIYWLDRRMERRMDRLENRMDRLEGRIDRLEGRIDRLEGGMDLRFREQEANFAQQLSDQEGRLTQQMQDVESRLTQQINGLESRQNLKFEELGEQIKELNDRVGNLERGQSRLEGQLDIIRDAMFQRAPS